MENNKRWKPDKGADYWFVSGSFFMVAADLYDGSDVDENRFDCGNMFKTKEEAMLAAEEIKNRLLSRVEKEKDLPVLTKAIFNHPDCPEWAKYAVVDVQGLAYWYQYSPLADERIGCWDNLKNKRQLIDGFFDKSDWQNSLVERTEKETKLPEWCRIGEWVRRTDVDEYHKVIAVDELGVSTVTNGIGAQHYWPNQRIKDKLQPARLRHYNTKEMKVLVGKVIEVEPGNFSLCLRVKGGYWADFLDDCSSDDDRARVISYDSFMLKARKTIDGEPCGVLEYFDGNEWVQ